MKGILRFDLSDPDDRREFSLACKARDYNLFVWDFSQEVLRKYCKYGLPEKYLGGEDLMEHIRDRFYELYNKYNLSED